MRDVLRLGPGSLRGKARRNATMDVLTKLGRRGFSATAGARRWPAIRLLSSGRLAGPVPVPGFPAGAD